MKAFDLFAGAGGASLGLHRAGLEVVAFERWDRACETHRAALPDMPVLQVDLAEVKWRLPLLAYGRPGLMWASPPCQPWSAAGAHGGEDDERDGIPHWLRALDEVRPDVAVMENVPGLTFSKHSDYLARMLDSVRQLGYELAWRLLDAADYGVGQSRERFILLARRDGGPLAWPTPTHCEHGGLVTDRWLAMADALDWGPDRHCPLTAWCYLRPATTIAGDPRVFQPGGHHQPGEQSANAIRIEVWQAGVLQGFPPDYPWQGNRTEQSTQVGNAVPPPLVEAIARALFPEETR